MLLYYPFWMFMGFTLHIYIIFGTNLLNGGPARIAIFCLFFAYRARPPISWAPRAATDVLLPPI